MRSIIIALKERYVKCQINWLERTGEEISLEDLRAVHAMDDDPERRYFMSFYLFCVHHPG